MSYQIRGFHILKLTDKGFIPCTSQIPHTVKSRDSLPSGVVTTVEELVNFLNL